jgi:hypothetical protein
VEATLNFDALLGQLFRNGERILPVVTLPRRFQRQGWEFCLPDLGPTHRFLFEVDWGLGTILVFRCFVNLGLVYEDRDSGQTVVRGSRLALHNHLIPAVSPTVPERPDLASQERQRMTNRLSEDPSTLLWTKRLQ